MDFETVKKVIYTNTISYFDNLSECKGLGVYFKNTEKVEGIAKTLSNSIDLPHQEIKRTFFKLGSEHYENSIPFYIFIDLINEIEKNVIGELGKDDSLDKNSLDKVSNYFELVRNSVSYGYLQKMIKSDKDIIRKELRSVKDKNSELRPFLRDYLIWINKVTEDIKKLRSCDIKNNVQWKNTFKNIDEKDYVGSLLSDDEIETIKDVHRKLINISFSIYYAIDKKKFTLLTSNYMELIKLVGKLISLATVNVAVRSLEGINIDYLTGLLNRKAMDFILNSQYQIAKLTGKPLSIVMLDLDDFKEINDTYGHLVGDCVLQNFAKELQENLRKSDFIFRYGGEEFLILMPFTEKRDACKVIRKLLEKISEEYICCGEDIFINLTFSAGIEDISSKHESIIDIIKLADKKMYLAKTTGKNKVVC
ncbi:GGDEF domain-containing protein [Persephonella sp.]